VRLQENAAAGLTTPVARKAVSGPRSAGADVREGEALSDGQHCRNPLGRQLLAASQQRVRDAVFPPNVAKPECTFSLTSIGGIRAEDVQSTQILGAGADLPLPFQHESPSAKRRTNDGSCMHPVPLSVISITWSASGPKAARTNSLRSPGRCGSSINSVLDSSVLSREAAWTPEDLIQLIPERSRPRK
jgi:hypothetical protein